MRAESTSFRIVSWSIPDPDSEPESRDFSIKERIVPAIDFPSVPARFLIRFSVSESIRIRITFVRISSTFLFESDLHV